LQTETPLWLLARWRFSFAVHLMVPTLAINWMDAISKCILIVDDSAPSGRSFGNFAKHLSGLELCGEAGEEKRYGQSHGTARHHIARGLPLDLSKRRL
jgi:hypothetical protein